MWLSFSSSILLLDQVSKSIVGYKIEYGNSIFVSSFFNIVHFKNPGAAFSFLADGNGWQRYLLITLSIAIIVWLIRLLLYKSRGVEHISCSLILGGALGNMFDRIFRGSVIDFLDLHWNANHWPAFNIADIAISIGVLLLISNFKKIKN